MTPELIAALRRVLDAADEHWDCGPDGEGWQSRELGGSCYMVREWLDTIDPPPPPKPLTEAEAAFHAQMMAFVLKTFPLVARAKD